MLNHNTLAPAPNKIQLTNIADSPFFCVRVEGLMFPYVGHSEMAEIAVTLHLPLPRFVLSTLT